MSGTWGMRSVGQQLMNSIHTVIHKLYVPIVTYSFILWEHVRSSEGRGGSHGVNAQANWEDNVLLEWWGVDSCGFTGFLKINWHQQPVGDSAESRKSFSPWMCFSYTESMLILSIGFNSNINLPGKEECGSAPTSPSLQLQDKNANNHSGHSPNPVPIENGNQIANGNFH